MKIFKNHKETFNRLTRVVFALSLLLLFYPTSIHAADLTALSDQMSRLKESEVSNHTITFTTPGGIAAGETVVLTFPAGFDVNAADNLLDYTDVDVTDDGADLTLAAAPSGATWGIGVTASAITLTSGTGTMAASSVIVFEIGTHATFGVTGDKQIVNQTAAQNNTDPVIVINGTFGDTGKVAVEIVADDQVLMTATVNPSISFSISANASDFATLSTSSVVQGATDITVTVGTNAASGYTVTVKDTGNGTNPGLYNSAASYLIGSTNSAYADGPTTLSFGTEGYGICVASTTGSPTIAARFGNSGADCTTTKIVGGLEVANTTFISRATAMSSNDSATIRHWAAIGAWTKAGSYTDTITYIGTGNF